jgi:hypothetical protein
MQPSPVLPADSEFESLLARVLELRRQQAQTAAPVPAQTAESTESSIDPKEQA